MQHNERRTTEQFPITAGFRAAWSQIVFINDNQYPD